MSEILGKVTGAIDVARGADVSLRIFVPRIWLLEGRTIEVELPRNLVCVMCSGGGCSRCQNSGAISVRGRNELPEVVQVCLPEQGDAATRRSMHEVAARNHGQAPSDATEPVKRKSVRPMIIRIPECGGLPDLSTSAIVRGWLLLHVGIADEASANVRLLDDDEPLSSSKMFRAEAKSQPSVDDVANVDTKSTEGDVSEAGVDAGGVPSIEGSRPSTRVAKVRSMRVSDPKSLARSSDPARSSLVTVGPVETEWFRRTLWLWAVALGALVGFLLALWVWSER